jgi:hypothetical protein
MKGVVTLLHKVTQFGFTQWMYEDRIRQSTLDGLLAFVSLKDLASLDVKNLNGV